ncbi:MAG: DEAD/DEAH box helicase [Planctomycetota bacterium]
MKSFIAGSVVPSQSTKTHDKPHAPHFPRVIDGTHETDGTHGTKTPHASADAGTFDTLGLSPQLLSVLVEQEYTVPTPIQAKAIPPALAGKDLLGCAQTGTGKTAAFALPILDRLMKAPAEKNRRGPMLPRALILSPTRELASQIGDSFRTYGKNTGLTGTIVFGGVSQHHQVKALQRGIDILVATPGRLMDLMEQGYVNLSEIQIFVLDEADRMLDMGFIMPIRRIASALPAAGAEGTGRQTMLFSATMPKEIMHLADSLLRNPVKVAVTPVAATTALIEQKLYMCPKMSKHQLLEHILREDKVERAVVFTKTKHGADKLSKKLILSGISTQAIHGNKAQGQRERALDAFRSGKARVLVATDVAARGLDVDGITHVFNYDLPMEPEGYVHRIGRTGRAGAKGVAISFCDREERGLLRDIERLTGKRIPLVNELPDLPPPVREVRDSEEDRGDERLERRSRSFEGGYSARPNRPMGKPSYPTRSAHPTARPAAAHGHSGGHSTPSPAAAKHGERRAGPVGGGRPLHPTARQGGGTFGRAGKGPKRSSH